MNDFKKNNFCVVENSLPKDVLDIATQYAFFDEMQNHSNQDDQVPNAFSKYGDPLMETILLHINPIMEENTGLKLFPTYSYYRIYRDGDELKNHTDRPACEISSTLCFNYEFGNDYKWPIYMNNKKIEQNSGDLVIYKGCELDHRRDKLVLNNTNAWQVQGFFHYVDANGPFADQKWDNRLSIGNNNKHSEIRTHEKSYIEYTK